MKKNYKVFLLIVVLIIYQSFLYLVSKLTPLDVTVLGNCLDNKIPFISIYIYFYISWYVMLIIVPYLIYEYDEDAFYKYVMSTFFIITVTSLIYIFFPTTIIRRPIIVNNLTTFLIDLIYRLDTPVMNCFPSMHCAISFLYIFIIFDSKVFPKKKKYFVYIWSLFVIASTLFINQHVIVDVISAFILSLFIYTITCRSGLWKIIVIKEN